MKGLSEQISSQSFFTSVHKFRNLPFFISLSHSGNYYVLGIASLSIGLDAEIYIDRKEQTYDKFIGSNKHLMLEDRKKMFYQKWLKREAIIKCSNSCDLNMSYTKVNDLVIGICSVNTENILYYQVDTLNGTFTEISTKPFI
ncbi:hypothetical protein RU85_GL001151 [Lactococcus garvieae]|nr:hypothetical protein RU85_GL001151 [Lactococcus garvieae]